MKTRNLNISLNISLQDMQVLIFLFLTLISFSSTSSLSSCMPFETFLALCSPCNDMICYLFTAIGFLPDGSGRLTCKKMGKIRVKEETIPKTIKDT